MYKIPKIKLKKAIEHFGTQVELAEALDVSKQQVTNWVNAYNHEYIPEKYAWRLVHWYPETFTKSLMKYDWRHYDQAKGATA